MPRYNITRRNNRVNNSNNSVSYRDYYDSRGRKKSTQSYTNTHTSISTLTTSGGLSYSINLGYTSILRYMFIFSLVVVILSLFIKGAFDPKFQELFNSEVYYTMNGYEYPVNYLNYDWTFKLNQLNGFEPIFDIEEWRKIIATNIVLTDGIFSGLAPIFNVLSILMIPLSILENLIWDFILAIGFITIW